MTSKGRPKYVKRETVNLGLNLNVKAHARLVRLAEQKGVTLNRVIRRAVDQYLDGVAGNG